MLPELIKKYETERQVITELLSNTEDENEVHKLQSVRRFLTQFIDDLKCPINWINVVDDLPEYEKPVFLKDEGGIYLGFRNSTSKEGESYLLLKKPNINEIRTNKITHWVSIEAVSFLNVL
jgi:hypothetical protein